MPILHRRRAQDKTVLSCPRLRCEMNSQHVKTVGDRKFRNWTCSAFFQFCPVSKCGVN